MLHAVILLSCAIAPAAAATAVEEQVEICLTCHGVDADQPETPILDGQPALFLQTQLDLFRGGQRGEMAMTDIAAGLAEEEIPALAAQFAARPPPGPAAGPADPALAALGREAAVRHRCITCHLPTFAGQAQMPRLAGQREAYLRKALRDYQSGARVGAGAMMADVMTGVSEAEMAALAHYLAHLGG